MPALMMLPIRPGARVYRVTVLEGLADGVGFGVVAADAEGAGGGTASPTSG